jgi:hypothetical protein
MVMDDGDGGLRDTDIGDGGWRMTMRYFWEKRRAGRLFLFGLLLQKFLDAGLAKGVGEGG